MSEHGERNIGELIKLTERLGALVGADADAFEARRPLLVAGRVEETQQLANLYRHETARVKADPDLLTGATAKSRDRLKQATLAFEAALTRHGRALQAAKTVTEGVVRAIAEEVARVRIASTGYGPASRNQASLATAITLNQRA